VGHYADDAVLMVPGEPATVGKDAIRSALKQMVSDPTLSLKFQATKVDTAGSGDLGYTQGWYTLTLTDPVSKQLINDHGSYVTVYRKQADGTWKSVSDITSSAVPPPPPPAPATKKH
jgi:ketosteroid isomerase-like protein